MMSESVLPAQFVPPLIVTSIREQSAGVRILTPTGKLAYVPEEKLADALAAGAVVMTPEKMRELRQAIFMQHGVFNEKNRKPVATRQRKSLWKQRSR